MSAAGQWDTDLWVTVIIGALGLLIIILQVRSAPRREKGYRAAEAIWQKRKSQWDDLYYCYRDDIIFLGGKPSQHAKPELMERLLNG